MSALFVGYYVFEFALVEYLYLSSFHFDYALSLEIPEHSRDDFARAAHVSRYLLVRERKRIAPRLGTFVVEKYRKTLVGAHKKYLLHRPHYVGKSHGSEFVCEIFEIYVFALYLLENLRADYHRTSIFFGVDVYVERNRVEYARRGKYAYVVFIKSVQSYFSAVVGQHVGAKLTALQIYHAETLVVGTVYAFAFCKSYLARRRYHKLLLLGCKAGEKFAALQYLFYAQLSDLRNYYIIRMKIFQRYRPF